MWSTVLVYALKYGYVIAKPAGLYFLGRVCREIKSGKAHADLVQGAAKIGMSEGDLNKIADGIINGLEKGFDADLDGDGDTGA